MDKLWKIESVYYPNGTPEITHLFSPTLYGAFQSFYKMYGTKSMTEIKITEVRPDE